MSTIVSITKQGQISIPIEIRKMLQLDIVKKALVSVEDNKIIVEPVTDILSLSGGLHHKAKAKPIDRTMEEEQEAVSEAIVERYKKKLSREA